MGFKFGWQLIRCGDGVIISSDRNHRAVVGANFIFPGRALVLGQPSFRFHAHLFGTFTLLQGKRVLALPPSGDARALLAYLLLNRESPHPRAVLVGLLFPDYSENRARRALTQSLWHIRRGLPKMVEADADAIHIPPAAPIWVDVEEFKKIADCRLQIHNLKS